MVEIHFRIRRAHWKWPTKARWYKWGKGRYPALRAQSVQQIIAEFFEALSSTTQLRKTDKSARYPWKKSKFRDVIYTNQVAKIKKRESGQYLVLPNGCGTFVIKLPVQPVGRLMEARLCFNKIILTFMIEDQQAEQKRVIGVDLGVNTLISATDGKKAVLVSGRGLKSIMQYRNKQLAALQAKQSKLSRGSRRWKRFQRRKGKMLGKVKNKVNDTVHKATRLIANEFPGTKCYVGKPFNGAAQKMGRVHAQQVSQACNGKIIQQLDYKTVGAIEVNESYTSQTCPVCGVRSKCRRTFQCKCGLTAPRDVVGAVNILCIGQNGNLLSDRKMPKKIKYLHVKCSSSGGRTGNSSRKRESA